MFKKLIITTKETGHTTYVSDKTLIEDSTDILVDEDTLKQEFEKIMIEGYGKDIPATFYAEYEDGSTNKFTRENAKDFICNPKIKEVIAIAQIQGG